MVASRPASPPRRILGPARLAVSVETAKASLRLAGIAAHDEEVERLIVAAVDLLDARGLLGYALEAQTWEAEWPALAGVLLLPLGPVDSVVSILWRDAAGVAQVVDPGTYVLDRAAEAVVPVAGWPDLGHAARAAAHPTVRWVAGTGCGPVEAAAIEQLVRHWFDGGVGLPHGLLDLLPRRRIAV